MSSFAPGPTRRCVLSSAAAAVLGTALPGRAAAALGRVADLRILAWPGYADDDLVQDFERRHGCRVAVNIVASDEVLWQRMQARQGGDFDVLALNTAELQRYIQADLVQAVPRAALRSQPEWQPRLRDLSAIGGLVRGVQVFGVPFVFADMGLIHDLRQMPQPPQSIRALWDPRWRGRVLAYDSGTHNFSLAAQVLGAPSPFRLRETDWVPAVEQLVALRRNAMGFYTQPEESVDWFMRRKAALMFANYGTQQLQLLRAAGAEVGYALPREGALAWLDCWAISRQAHDTQLAAAWIDHMLGTAAAAVMRQRHGLSHVRTKAAPDGTQGLWWLEPPEDTARRNRLWRRIVAGDLVSRVLLP
ncbi:MAG: ABC transporter substrate-binding protein [Pseudomonadota bacterium]